MAKDQTTPEQLLLHEQSPVFPSNGRSAHWAFPLEYRLVPSMIFRLSRKRYSRGSRDIT